MVRTEGQRQLKLYVARLGRGAQRRLARAIGRSDPTVSTLLSGLYLPDVETAAKIEEVAGVPMRAWAKRPDRKRKAS